MTGRSFTGMRCDKSSSTLISLAVSLQPQPTHKCPGPLLFHELGCALASTSHPAAFVVCEHFHGDIGALVKQVHACKSKPNQHCTSELTSMQHEGRS